MRRATNKRVVLQKQSLKARKRVITPAARTLGGNSIYEEAKRRNGELHVCIIRAVGGIGDVMMTTPGMLQLKREFPSIKITFAVDRHRSGAEDIYYDLVHNAWFIDEVIDARYVDRTAYDVVVDVSSVCIRYERKGLPPINRIDLFARACGVTRLRNKTPFYKVEPQEQLWATVKLSPWRKRSKRIVVIHTASFEGKRSWTPSHWMDLIRYTEEHCPAIQFVVMDYNGVLSGLDQFENCHDVSHATIREKAAYINACDLFIGPDSGPMHLAGALGKSSLVIFGSIPPEARINHYPNHESIQLKELSCLGCWYAACPIQIQCMTGLSHLTVYNRMITKLGATNA